MYDATLSFVCLQHTLTGMSLANEWRADGEMNPGSKYHVHRHSPNECQAKPPVGDGDGEGARDRDLNALWHIGAEIVSGEHTLICKLSMLES